MVMVGYVIFIPICNEQLDAYVWDESQPPTNIKYVTLGYHGWQFSNGVHVQTMLAIAKEKPRKAAEKPLSVVRPFGHRAMVRRRIQRHRNFKRVTRSATMCRAGTGPMSSRKVVVSDPMDSMDPQNIQYFGENLHWVSHGWSL